MKCVECGRWAYLGFLCRECHRDLYGETEEEEETDLD